MWAFFISCHFAHASRRSGILDGMPPPNPNPYRGVSWHKKQRRWRVKLKQRVHGRPPLEFYMEFPDEPGAAELAARVYDTAARIVHGKCRTLNFPGEALPDEVDPERIRRKLLDAGWPAMSLR